jgi:uracil-DNA glycosylase
METVPGQSGDLSAPFRGRQLRELHRELATCRRCVDAGILAGAAPVLPAPIPSQIVLVGQAPGRLEEETRRPFSGRAGRQLFSWLARAGIPSEEEARRRVYLTSITKCFPGRSPGGAGDRRPGAREVEMCRPHLDRQLALLAPWLILPVGQLAIDRFLPGRPLSLVVGRLFDGARRELPARSPVSPGLLPLLLPLPHPSGASRWLNRPEHQDLLEQALERLSQLLVPLAEAREAAIVGRDLGCQ